MVYCNPWPSKKETTDTKQRLGSRPATLKARLDQARAAELVISEQIVGVLNKIRAGLIPPLEGVKERERLFNRLLKAQQQTEAIRKYPLNGLPKG